MSADPFGGSRRTAGDARVTCEHGHVGDPKACPGCYPDQVPPDLSKMNELSERAVVARLSKEPPVWVPDTPDLDPVDAAARLVARQARALLRPRSGVTRESASRDGKTVALTVHASTLQAMRDALQAWDDAVHAAVGGGGR